MATNVINHLLVELVSQRSRTQCLSLTSGEQRGSVSPGQDLRLTGDSPDLVESAAIDAPLLFEDHAPHVSAYELFESVLDLASTFRKLLGKRFLDFVAEGVEQSAAIFPRIRMICLDDASPCQFLDSTDEIGRRAWPP